MNTLTTPDEFGIKVPHILITRTGLEVEESASEEDLVRLEQVLDTVGGSALWWWGDYLNHLASTRGVEYAEAKAASSYAPHTLKNASWVCRHVARSRRRDQPISFSHHAEVAALSPTEQEVWLGKAEDNEWSQKQLRAEIRQSKAQVQNGPEQAPIDPRAARASEGFELFSVWYQTEADNFTEAQRREWDQALAPIVADCLSRLTAADVERLRAAAAGEDQD